MTNIVSLSAVSNKFLNNDNHLNIAAVQELEGKIQAIVKALPVTNEKGKVLKRPIPEQCFTVNRRKKIEKFNSAKNNAGDLTYLTKRAIPVKASRQLTERGSIRNMALLTIYPVDKMEKVYGDDPFAKLRKTIKECVSAMNTHMKRADKTKEGVTKERVKNREIANTAFTKAIKAFRKVLADAGIDMDKDLVESKGMMGQTILLRMGKDDVVSIGKSDISKFKEAKRKAAEAEDDDAPKKKKIGAGKAAKKITEKVKSKSSKKVVEKPAKKKLKSSKSSKDVGAVSKLKKKKKVSR